MVACLRNDNIKMQINVSVNGEKFASQFAIKIFCLAKVSCKYLMLLCETSAFSAVCLMCTFIS